MSRIKIVNLSHNILADDISLAPKNDSVAINVLGDNLMLVATESSSLYELVEEMGMWGSAMFGESGILGQRREASQVVRTFSQLNVIRTA